LRRHPPRIIAISCDSLDVDGTTHWLREAVRVGLPAIQLRNKLLSDNDRLTIGRSVEPAPPTGTTCIVNGRADLALSLGWRAVHLPGGGVPVSSVRTILGGNALVGRSTHSVLEVESAAAEGADYAVLGPIFDTPSKRSFGPPLGLPSLQEAVDRVAIPVLAIGGITAARFDRVAQTGAYGVAAISLFRTPSCAASILDAFAAAFEG